MHQTEKEVVSPGQEEENAPKPVIYIWTIQLAKWRIAKEREIKLLDITAKTGVEAFAPDFNAVFKYKRGEMSEHDYTQLYLERMKQSKKDNPKIWSHLDHYPKIALACYCRAGVFCHRHLFADLMAEHLKEQGRESRYQGELI